MISYNTQICLLMRETCIFQEDLLLSHNNNAVMDKFDIDSFMENLQKTVKFKVNIIFNNADSILFILKKIKMIIEGEH